MSNPDVFWFLPTSGDTPYLREITQAADRLGYDA